MTDQDKKRDSIETPEGVPLRYFCKEPAEKGRVQREQEQGMSEIPVILQVKLTVEEAEDEIRIREDPSREACDRPPISNPFIVDGPRNNRPRNNMSKTIHAFMVTCIPILQQIGNGFAVG